MARCPVYILRRNRAELRAFPGASEVERMIYNGGELKDTVLDS